MRRSRSSRRPRASSCVALAASARDAVGAGRERNRRPRRRHVAVDALDRRPADTARRRQGRRADVSRARAREAPRRPRDVRRRRRASPPCRHATASVCAARSGRSPAGRREGGPRSATRSRARSSSRASAFGETAGVVGPGSIPENAVSILFLSDGRQNRGSAPARGRARRARLPRGSRSYTVALGTDRPDGAGGGRPGLRRIRLRRLHRVPDRARCARSPRRRTASTSRRARRRRSSRRTAARLEARPRGPADRGDGALRGRGGRRASTAAGRARASAPPPGHPRSRGPAPGAGAGAGPPIRQAVTRAGCSG